jgi:hypothetical protein
LGHGLVGAFGRKGPFCAEALSIPVAAKSASAAIDAPLRPPVRLFSTVFILSFSNIFFIKLLLQMAAYHVKIGLSSGELALFLEGF